ncbi:MAG: hypothetical protein R2706_14520 [Acidimicrobiales bacterium]
MVGAAVVGGRVVAGAFVVEGAAVIAGAVVAVVEATVVVASSTSVVSISTVSVVGASVVVDVGTEVGSPVVDVLSDSVFCIYPSTNRLVVPRQTRHAENDTIDGEKHNEPAHPSPASCFTQSVEHRYSEHPML